MNFALEVLHLTKVGRKMIIIKPIKTLFALLGLCTAFAANSATFRLPSDGSDIIGKVRIGYAQSGEAMWEVGRRYGIGVDEMVRVNPGLNPTAHLSSNKKLIIPSRFILPSGPRRGIVINLAELRLYYYPEGTNTVVTEPVGIGREGWSTPIGETSITLKRPDPIWRPTPAVKKEAADNGYDIPDVFPAGPDNPLGPFAMNLGWPTYLIHGTSRPDGVGGRSSAGCIRLYNEAITRLYPIVGVGTPVRVINEPYKVGWLKNELYIEAHEPLAEDAGKYSLDMGPFVKQIYAKTKLRPAHIDWESTKKFAQNFVGIPRPIGIAY